MTNSARPAENPWKLQIYTSIPWREPVVAAVSRTCECWWMDICEQWAHDDSMPSLRSARRYQPYIEYTVNGLLNSQRHSYGGVILPKWSGKHDVTTLTGIGLLLSSPTTFIFVHQWCPIMACSLDSTAVSWPVNHETFLPVHNDHIVDARWFMGSFHKSV